MNVKAQSLLGVLHVMLNPNDQVHVHKEFLGTGYGISIWIADRKTADEVLAAAEPSDQLCQWDDVVKRAVAAEEESENYRISARLSETKLDELVKDVQIALDLFPQNPDHALLILRGLLKGGADDGKDNS